MKSRKIIEKIQRINSVDDLKYKIRTKIRHGVLERNYPENFKVTKVPKYIHIELNNTCNLGCIMCSYRNMKRKKQFMTMELFKKIINDCSKNGIRYVRLFAMGEPLMHPKLFEMIKYAKSHGIGFADINSNANLLTKDRARKIIESGLDRVVFSVDGNTQNTYGKIRVGGNLEKVKENITYLVKMRKEMKKRKPQIFIQSIRMKETEKEIDGVVKYWEKLVDGVGIVDVMNQGGQVPEMGDASEVRRPCPYLWNMMTVCANGDVSVCCIDTECVLNVGNVNKKNLREIWHGDKINKMRELHKQRKFKSMPLCGNCSAF